MVYITGDMHGDPARVHDRRLRRIKKGDTLIVCGDFGYIWNNSEQERKLLAQWQKKRFTVAFLDGVHENFDLLEAYPTAPWQGGTARHIGGNVWHLLRGEIYEIEGASYFVMGGGEEPEQDIRRQANTWWEREMPSEEEMVRAFDRLAARNYCVDIVLSHEPSGKTGGQNITGQRELNGVHLFLSRLESLLTFSHWYFGALHIDKAVSRRHTAVFREIIPVNRPRHAR